MEEDIIIPIAGMLMIIIVSVGIPLIVMLGRKWERDAKQQRITPELSTRLDRLDQAVDAIAIEVERISEGQRFTTRLLADRMPDQIGAPGRARPRPDEP